MSSKSSNKGRTVPCLSLRLSMPFEQVWTAGVSPSINLITTTEKKLYTNLSLSFWKPTQMLIERPSSGRRAVKNVNSVQKKMTLPPPSNCKLLLNVVSFCVVLMKGNLLPVAVPFCVSTGLVKKGKKSYAHMLVWSGTRNSASWSLCQHSGFSVFFLSNFQSPFLRQYFDQRRSQYILDHAGRRNLVGER